MRQVLASLGPQHRKVIAEIATDTRGRLRDLGLSECLSEPAANEPPAREAPVSDITARFIEVGHAVASLFGVHPIDPAEEEVLEHLEMDIEYLALEAASRVTTPVRSVLANVLPTLMLAHIFYRIGDAWFQANYLPWNFYGMALGLMVASLIPGYLLLNVAVRAEASLPDVEKIVDRLTEPYVTSPLRSARKRLQRFLQDAIRLRQDLLDTRRSLEDKFGSADFGARQEAPSTAWPPRGPEVYSTEPQSDGDGSAVSTVAS